MLFDAAGREIPDTPAAATTVVAERLIHFEDSDRTEADVSRAMSPSSLDAILLQANSGDTSAQARLSVEVEEKDWDTGQALSTRRAAVLGLERRCVPSVADDERAKDIADTATAMLEAVLPQNDADVGFDGAIDHMLSALLPGYSWLEILWGPGGKEIEAFAPGPGWAITYRLSRTPLIATTRNAMGDPMTPHKFVFHRHRARSGDAARGGLIRPLGWMYLFANLAVKDLVRFVEKFGMPFVSARLDDNAWDKDRERIAYLIRNFGSDGGGVFSKAVELEMIEANKSNGEVYFKLLEYFGAAKTKVVLGQTASSGDSGGMSKGDAQSAVRQDILESDCNAVAATIKRDILTPWTAYNYGPDEPVPGFKFEYEPPQDLVAKADMIGKLSLAGYQVEPAHIETEFGVPLTKGPDGEPTVKPASDLFKYHLDYQIPTKNEVRARLGLPPIPGGEQPASPPEMAAALRGERDVFIMADAEAAAERKKKGSRTRPTHRMSRW